jgi:hypothetical protein
MKNTPPIELLEQKYDEWVRHERVISLAKELFLKEYETECGYTEYQIKDMLNEADSFYKAVDEWVKLQEAKCGEMPEIMYGDLVVADTDYFKVTHFPYENVISGSNFSCNIGNVSAIHRLIEGELACIWRREGC